MRIPIEVGTTVAQKRVLTQQDYDRFAALTRDDNPIHVDPAFSARTRFGKTVAHGMFLYSLICGLLEQRLPGATLLEQELMFPAQTYVGEQVTVRLTVTDVQPAEQLAHLMTIVEHKSGQVGCQGRMLIRWVQV